MRILSRINGWNQNEVHVNKVDAMTPEPHPHKCSRQCLFEQMGQCTFSCRDFVLKDSPTAAEQVFGDLDAILTTETKEYTEHWLQQDGFAALRYIQEKLAELRAQRGERER